MQTSKTSWRFLSDCSGLLAKPVRGFRKTAAPGAYNLRFRPSQGLDNVYVHYWSNIHGANGVESHKTERNPNKFAYSNNLFKNDMWEWRMRAADYLYQIYSRLHRSNDGWTRTLIGYTSFCFLIYEWDQGRENPYFPEYRTPLSKFFNADMNTSTGRYKIGDVESGATMTLHFKTMPFSNNKYNFTEPFLIYDMWAEINHNGKYHVENIVKAEETLKTKRIFVLWH